MLHHASSENNFNLNVDFLSNVVIAFDIYLLYYVVICSNILKIYRRLKS
ncbi:hypothetical protein DOY81_010769 [Sarcophaga bullata]|nr:hypothetical protein DOY81_010769 [Sarcophaga bullata]